MGLLQRLEIRQGQSLVMTPQLLQAIKLLQLSHLDLAAYVDAELERNPLLERGETGTAERHREADAEADGPRCRRDDEALADDLDTAAAERDREAEHETDLDNVFPDDSPVLAREAADPGDTLPLVGLALDGSGGGRGFDGDGARFPGDADARDVALPSISSAQLDLATRDPGTGSSAAT